MDIETALKYADSNEVVNDYDEAIKVLALQVRKLDGVALKAREILSVFNNADYDIGDDEFNALMAILDIRLEDSGYFWREVNLAPLHQRHCRAMAGFVCSCLKHREVSHEM